MATNTYSIINVLGTIINGEDGNTIVNIFNKINLLNLPTAVTCYSTYQITNGDRLDLISTKFYNTPNLWWVIAASNGIKDPFADLLSLGTLSILIVQYIPNLILQLKGYL